MVNCNQHTILLAELTEYILSLLTVWKSQKKNAKGVVKTWRTFMQKSHVWYRIHYSRWAVNTPCICLVPFFLSSPLSHVWFNQSPPSQEFGVTWFSHQDNLSEPVCHHTYQLHITCLNWARLSYTETWSNGSSACCEQVGFGMPVFTPRKASNPGYVEGLKDFSNAHIKQH